MAQQKKRIFWIGFARVCAKSLFCQGFTAKRNDAQKTQSMHYGSCSALLLLQKADRQPPLREKGAAARISGVVRRLRPFCHRCPGASGRTPQKMHHACKAWCTVSTSGRFAIKTPCFISKWGVFLTFLAYLIFVLIRKFNFSSTRFQSQAFLRNISEPQVFFSRFWYFV